MRVDSRCPSFGVQFPKRFVTVLLKNQSWKLAIAVAIFSKDRRRKHHHWQVTVYYGDGEKFARVYIVQGKARRFAERQKKSPVVKRTLVRRIS